MPSTALSKITYVEDEPDIREVGLLALEALGGFEVDACPNGIAAINRVPAFAPDLIVLDVMMPELDGVETFHRLRALPDAELVPIIFMTARLQDGDLQQYEELGCAGVIEKPFDPMVLADQLRELWQKGSPSPVRGTGAES